MFRTQRPPKCRRALRSATHGSAAKRGSGSGTAAKSFSAFSAPTPFLVSKGSSNLGEVRSGSAKVDVEGDHRRTCVAQLVDELCDDGARPRPLTDLAEAGVVNIDDADRHAPASRGAAF